ncbi:hypothetical protein NIES4101_53570 [Calothrix sp. NIES-4101]|nr:hypothetical protein NIES4101_53570 [Calothrix sp. NIES-4101]
MTLKISQPQALAEYYAENGWRTQPFTITYIEDANPTTWEPRPNQPDLFNDVRIVWRPKEEEIIVSCAATTEPGIRAVNNPMNRNGTFRIALDTHFKECWEIGRHITRSSNQLALVQCDRILGYRDADRNHIRPGDKLYDDGAGVNHHTTGNSADSPAPDRVGGFSFGCLVGQHPVTHYRKFMPALQDSGQRRFDTVVLNGSKFWKWLQEKDYVLS